MPGMDPSWGDVSCLPKLDLDPLRGIHDSVLFKRRSTHSVSPGSHDCLSRSARVPSWELQGHSQVECSQLMRRAAYSREGGINLSIFTVGWSQAWCRQWGPKGQLKTQGSSPQASLRTFKDSSHVGHFWSSLIPATIPHWAEDNDGPSLVCVPQWVVLSTGLTLQMVSDRWTGTGHICFWFLG